MSGVFRRLAFIARQITANILLNRPNRGEIDARFDLQRSDLDHRDSARQAILDLVGAQFLTALVAHAGDGPFGHVDRLGNSRLFPGVRQAGLPAITTIGLTKVPGVGMEDHGIDQIALVPKRIYQHFVFSAADAALHADVQIVTKNIANFFGPDWGNLQVLLNRAPIEMLVVAIIFVADFNVLDD